MIDEIPKFCKANPAAVTHSLSNCAEFYNCSDGNKAHECHYPDLFSKATHKCENFTGVQCDNRTEPQAPCKYNFYELSIVVMVAGARWTNHILLTYMHGHRDFRILGYWPNDSLKHTENIYLLEAIDSKICKLEILCIETKV